MANPEVCVLKTDGINCEGEMAYAFDVAGATSDIVHVNELRAGTKRLGDYAMLAIPGGFSYGDDVASGKVLATEMTSFLSDQMHAFVEDGRPVLGICNGFQVLVRTGLLPDRQLGSQSVTLTNNETGRFECRWTDLMIGRSVCRFVKPQEFDEYGKRPIPMQVAHGEGRFFARGLDAYDLLQRRQVVFQYSTPNLALPDGAFPDNPNGSDLDIAGICDPSGRILGMMPHPERSIDAFHPHRVRTEAARSAAMMLFQNIVECASEL